MTTREGRVETVTSEVFGGAMSGTSLDGVDVVLARFDGEAGAVSDTVLTVLAHVRVPYPAALRDAILAICHGQALSLPQLGALDLAVARQYVQAIRLALTQAALAPGQVEAVGVHGQTVYHQPSGPDRFTMQIGDPNTIAVGARVPVVADFRRRDMALGGQGAPLAPGFHEHWFRHPSITRVILNGGGIANITSLVPGQATYGFDTGPANVLMDGWCAQKTGRAFDEGGAWARSGQILPPLLETLLAEPYLQLPHPKSTGRELFHLDWLQGCLAASGCLGGADADVMRTLLEFSTRSVADAVQRVDSVGGELYVCGGAAMNLFFMQHLAELLPRWSVQSTTARGIAPDQVEAIAFASFARRTVHGLPGNLPSVTGARRTCILGALYSV
ncbi:MAG: anhydro-N-acetylmuramic acid kinase [Rhodoferax sp.]|nr:anhydro-N-acetylmuramic acid kinase [Rhodoferax sp.]